MGAGLRWMAAVALCCQQHTGITCWLSVAGSVLVGIGGAFKTLFHPVVSFIAHHHLWKWGGRRRRQNTNQSRVQSVKWVYINLHLWRILSPFQTDYQVPVFIVSWNCHRQDGSCYLCSKTLAVIEKAPHSLIYHCVSINQSSVWMSELASDCCAQSFYSTHIIRVHTGRHITYAKGGVAAVCRHLDDVSIYSFR